jgi:hypothetical protein
MHGFCLKFDACREMRKQVLDDDHHRDSDRRGFELLVGVHAGTPSAVVE